VSYFWVSMIGRSLGLIFSGIRQSLGWRWDYTWFDCDFHFPWHSADTEWSTVDSCNLDSFLWLSDYALDILIAMIRPSFYLICFLVCLHSN
jgi:hypothetical protein